MSNSRIAPILAGLAMVGAIAAAVLWWPRAAEPEPAPTKVAPAPVVPDPVASAAKAPVAPAPTPAPKAPAVAAVMTFPDGSTAPALNGVTEPVKLIWNDRPYSPIKEKVVHAGWEWYVHEDGSHSTVRMVDMNGVPAPFGLVASPTDALPTLDELETLLKKQGQPQGQPQTPPR